MWRCSKFHRSIFLNPHLIGTLPFMAAAVVGKVHRRLFPVRQHGTVQEKLQRIMQRFRKDNECLFSFFLVTHCSDTTNFELTKIAFKRQALNIITIHVRIQSQHIPYIGQKDGRHEASTWLMSPIGPFPIFPWNQSLRCKKLFQGDTGPVEPSNTSSVYARRSWSP
jgi:hypothetical protein